MVGTGEGFFAVDEPIVLVELAFESPEMVVDTGVVRPEGNEKLSVLLELIEAIEKLAAKEARHHVDRKKEVRCSVKPTSGAPSGESAGGNDGVEMGMETHSIRIPTVRESRSTIRSIHTTVASSRLHIARVMKMALSLS